MEETHVNYYKTKANGWAELSFDIKLLLPNTTQNKEPTRLGPWRAASEKGFNRHSA